MARQDLTSKHESLARLPKVETGVPSGDGWHARVEPGISSFGPNPEAIDAYLKPLLDHALDIIPSDRIADTPIFLLATAGMRLLPRPQQQAILQRACQYIQTHYEFYIKHCSENVRIISGEEEGLFGWIAVNYLMDGFDAHVHGEEHSSTYGFLDMGGASTQIAFEPSPSEQIKHADNLVNVVLRNLDGRTLTHPVFVTTWLGYGTNQARQRYVDAIISRQSTEAKAAQTEGLGTERLTTTLNDPCLPVELLLAESGKHAGYMMKGTGDFESCVKSTSPLLNKDAPCLDKPCLFNGVHAPSIDFEVNRFIGISEYWYSTHDVFSMGGMYDFVAFEKSAIEFCKQPWQQIVDSHSAGLKWAPTVELSRLEMQCFKAAWIVNILHEGIGIPRIVDAGGKGSGRNESEKALLKADEKGFTVSEKGRPPSFQSLEQVGDVSISWTLGKMVLEVSQSVDRQSGGSGSKWSDRLPDWKEGFNSGIEAVKKPAPLLFVPAVLGILLLWFLCMRCRASHKGKAFGGYFAPSRRRQDTTYNFGDMDTSGSKEKPLTFRRLVSSLFRRSRSREGAVLPMHLTTDVPLRPHATLRHAVSSPNLSSASFRPPGYVSPNGSSPSLPYNPDFNSSLRSLKVNNKPKWQLGLGRTRGISNNSEDDGFTAAGYESDAPSTPMPEPDLPASLIGRASSLRPASRAASATNLASGYFGRRKEKGTMDV